MKFINLSQNKQAIVDDEDYPLLCKYKWTFHPCGYAYRNQKLNGKIKKVYMHRFIMNYNGEKDIDHINHNGLDNRKSNLRIASRSENLANKGKSANHSSKYKGVCYDKSKSKWVCYIQVRKKQIFLGRYETEKEAGMMYNHFASLYFGEFACLNNIKEVIA